jgi:hypothetical protein
MRRIDLRYLKRNNFLEPGYSGSLYWSCGRRSTGSVGFESRWYGIALNYNVRNRSGEWEEVEDWIPFEWTEQHFGGQRQWFSCPGCKRNCLVLYGGAYFRCRKCYNLAYSSQNERPAPRLRRRAGRIMEKIGGSVDDLDADFYPPKPKGMHWKTYNQLCDKSDEICELSNYHFAKDIARFLRL